MNKFRINFVIYGSYDTSQDTVEQAEKEFEAMRLQDLIDRAEDYKVDIASIFEIELRKIK